MKKKGFTLVEMLAVIVILGILSGVAIIGVTRYLKQANEDEVNIMRSTIVSSFQNYRVKNTVAKDEKVLIDNLSFTKKLNYSSNICESNSNNTIYYSTKEGSLEEYYCVKMICNGETIIDDTKTNALCK